VIEKGKDSLLATAEEAADWYILLEDEDVVTEGDRRTFVQWLRRSPTNIEEFMRVGALHRHLADVSVAELQSVSELINEARSNVIEMDGARETHTHCVVKNKSRPPARRRQLAKIAATIAIAALPFFWFASDGFDLLNLRGEGEYVIETALGEQRSTVLPDGSVVNLNTQSRLEIRYSDEYRLVELIAGEVVFDVAKDASRPFRVRAGSTVVEAIGTQFNVYQQLDQIVITVVEGQVSVTNSKQPALIENPSNSSPGSQVDGNSVRLAEGYQTSVSMSGVIAATSVADPVVATAWTSRRLVFDGDALEVVARELNRYNAKQLRIGNLQVSRRAVSGVFDSNDPATLVAFLDEIGGLRVEQDASGNGWAVYADSEAPSQH
tara:strand:+ start:697 stop:1833 length:1137 start_codon:yes stop_codon:yes gene_type:complete